MKYEFVSSVDLCDHNIKKKNRRRAINRLLSLSEEGINLGAKKNKQAYSRREELYNRK